MIHDLKLYIIGALIGMLSSSLGQLYRRWRWPERPSDDQLAEYLRTVWEVPEKSIATILGERMMVEHWEENWRLHWTPADAGFQKVKTKNSRRARWVRAPAIVAAALGAWLALSSFGPAPQACTEASAAFVLRQAVERPVQSNGIQISVPAGYAVAWSCASLDEARDELARRIADVQK